MKYLHRVHCTDYRRNFIMMRAAFTLLFVCFVLSFQSLNSRTYQKNRAIFLTDIEAGPDDTQSMIRWFLYSNAIDIKGFIATTSIHQKNKVHPESIRSLIQEYDKVQPNLLKHEADFPNSGDLLKCVKQGLPEYGMEGDTPSFLSLVPNGLSVPEHPDRGGCGGRYEKYMPEYSSNKSGFTGGVPIEPESR